MPELLLLDMQFDEGEADTLCGDLESLAQSVRFGGDRERALAQLRRFQGVFLAQCARKLAFGGPIVLFGTLPSQQAERLVATQAPLRILEGLLFEPVREALLWASELVGVRSE